MWTHSEDDPDTLEAAEPLNTESFTEPASGAEQELSGRDVPDDELQTLSVCLTLYICRRYSLSSSSSIITIQSDRLQPTTSSVFIRHQPCCDWAVLQI